ncbi:MAG: nucleotidyltransferase domain-containing protein [Bacteroidetes bacterium]|nr:nucleotidyltransferase domain-containing protein [Bacteroidota bacterium]
MNYGLKDEELIAIRRVFASFTQVEKAVIYGSRAKGTFKPASDIDITVVGSELNTSILNQIANELDDLLLPYQIDLSIYHHISNPDLIEHISRVGKSLYEKGDGPFVE